ncbi:hybrid sensor histidine kinase/response regulator [Desulfobulbus alkaliphilus]|uniref:hybrid sensor histidine kinase/response regulator n=1 Tax=Desulfobulbus alkaliphilus TaxID=869814 RepID=UPI00196236B6|nr:PAS domain-containing sensor histidine kinase [Desulfobulbus alkaliphilus]MBM9537813.1 PAS domain S-box protein [Desulfobulbus alkaliphilus]
MTDNPQGSVPPATVSALRKQAKEQTPEEIQRMLNELEMQNEELRTAQGQIEAERARYFDLYDEAPVGYCTLSEQGVILEVNLTAATLLGTTRSALATQPLARFIHYDDQDIYDLHRKQLLETGTLQVCDLRLVKPEGGCTWAHLKGTVDQADDGAPVCRVVISDISGRKQMEKTLQESEERFQKMLSLVPDMISIHDTGMNILYSNWNGLGAVSQEKRVLNTKCYRTYRGHDDICPDCLAKTVMETGKPFQREAKLSDGRWVDLRVFPILDENGEAELFVEWVRDITENKQAEDALVQNKNLLEGIINGTSDILAIQKPDHTIEFYNQAGYDAIGLPPGAALNRKCYQLIGRESECDLCTSQAALRTKKLVEQERYVPELNQHFNCRSNPIFDTDGNVVNIIQQLRDITERKQAEEERTKLQEQLTQAQKMETVGRLAGGVAHDFNNMLGVILGYTEMTLEQVPAGHPMYKALHGIQQAAQRSADLTRQLLTFARKQTIAPKRIDLNETVEGGLKMLRRLIGEDIDLIWLPGRNLRPVKMDPNQIDQILANLCVNARDAIKGVGKVTVETSNTVFGAEYCARHAGFLPGEYVLLAVSDNGCGMDRETISHLFEPFFTTKEQGKGTGLGLASVYGAVKQNKGFINVYSEPGQGTTFKIYLPQYAIRTEAPSRQEPAEAAARGHETILLVEDEPVILEMTTMMLERLGYTVMAADTPGEAIRLAREHSGSIDLLLTDVVMPEMNGRELGQNILSVYPDMKRLFMSGYTANVIAHHGVLGERVHFIQKPFLMTDLAAKIREALDNGEPLKRKI